MNREELAGFWRNLVGEELHAVRFEVRYLMPLSVAKVSCIALVHGSFPA